MLGQQEIELKLVLPESDLHRLEEAPLLRQAAAAARTEQLTSVYYDTRRFKLRKAGVSLRVRSDGKGYVQTVKSEPGEARDVTSRGEWEAEIPGTQPDFDAARGSALEPLLSKKLRRALKPVFETRIERRVFPLQSGDASVELALDRGQIETAGKSADICEIEIELKEGDRAELFHLARLLAEAAPLRLSVRSKAARGYELVEGKATEPAASDRVVVRAGSSAAAAFQTIAESCLHQVAGNWEAVHHGDPAGFHEMRIGLRRLRAALSLFSEMLGDRQSRQIRKELKWLTGELAPARQLDVFTQHVLEPLGNAHPREGVKVFVDEVVRRQDEAEARAKVAVESERFRNLLLDTAEWILAGDWTATQDELARATRERIIDHVAVDILSRRHAKIVKRGRKLRKLDAPKRHKLRIAVKKLRYGSEFFAGLFAAPNARRQRKSFLQALKSLQDGLGDLNDIAAHQMFCASVAGETKPRQGDKCQVAYWAGLAAGRDDAQFQPLLQSSARAFRGFRNVDPFWP